ncbi:arsenate reductase, glutathione/glutaredoxin type [Leptothermofonsia sp. ETS-13]|uniref:arsenate reductase, glutathione/glutaredoxin type n=1 Tax=Leptothermofonsia sp. ETS-13 TaxID=3035696 RepID=UPI003BA022BC
MSPTFPYLLYLIMKRIMFVCTHNARRSQMAEGFARAIAGERIEVTSAGLEISQVDPMTIQAMAEVGIEIRNQTSKRLRDFAPEDYDAVISLCSCGVKLPTDWLLREVFEDWQLEDPEGQSMATFRCVRDEIKVRVEKLIQTLTAGRPATF